MSEPQIVEVTGTEAKFYDPASNDYDLSKDPRCLWGWGGCGCYFGHACFRELGHKGRCWEGGDKPIPKHDLKCASSLRPKNWDERGRAECNK